MKHVSTGKRLLVLICALIIALGTGLHGNAVTVRAAEENSSSSSLNNMTEEQAQAIADLWVILSSMPTEDALLEYISKNEDKFLDLMVKAGIITQAERSNAKAQIDALIRARFGSREPEKTPSELALEKAKKDLQTYHPLIAKTGTPLRMVDLGEYHTVGKKLMQEIATQVGYGYNVVLFSRYEKKDRVILIPAGSTVDLSLDWYGPLCLSELYEDITEEYKAQDKSLSKFLKVKNIIDGK